jgi:hypothetical protein
MGADQGGKEEGLAPFYGGRKRDSHLGRVIRFSACPYAGFLVCHQHRIFLQFLY